MNQVLLGVSVPFVIGLLFYIACGFRATIRMLVAVPVCMGLSALWAVAPDLPRLFGRQELYLRLSLDPRCDIFYWHYTIDMMEADSPWLAAAFVAILVSMLFAAWRELYLSETNNT